MQRISGFRRVGDPGLEPGTSSLSGKTFCPLQSSQLALNPCKPLRRHQRKGTGGDWPLQAGGPIVAPRRRCEGTVSYDPEADITATIRSDPDTGEECRDEPAGSRRRRQTHRGCRCPGWRRDGPGPGSAPAVAMPPQQRRLPSYLDLGGAAKKPAPLWVSGGEPAVEGIAGGPG